MSGRQDFLYPLVAIEFRRQEGTLGMFPLEKVEKFRFVSKVRSAFETKKND